MRHDAALRRLAILYELTASLSRGVNVERVLHDFAHTLARSLVLDAVVIFDVNGPGDQDWMEPLCAAGLPNSVVSALRVARPSRSAHVRSGTVDAEPMRGEIGRAVSLDLRQVEVCELRSTAGVWGTLVVAGRDVGRSALVGDVLHQIAPTLAFVLQREAERVAALEAERQRAMLEVETLRERQELIERALAERSVSSAIVEAALEGIILIDAHGRILEFNGAAERMFGRPRGNTLGHSLADIVIPPELREAHADGMSRCRETGEMPIEGRRLAMPALRADGTRFQVELTVVRLAGRQPVEFVGFLRDLTTENTTRRALELERTRLSLVLRYCPTVLLLVDEAGRIAIASDSCADVLGYTPTELCRLSVEDLIPAAMRQGHASMRRSALRSDDVVLRMRGGPFPVVRKDSSVIQADISLGLTSFEGQQMVVVSLADVTARMAAAEKQRRLEAELQQVGKMQALGTMASGVAHYFNNMLAVVMGNLEMLQGTSVSSDGVARPIHDMLSATRRAAELVRQILAFSRQGPSPRTVIDVADLVDEAVRMLRPVTAAGITISVHVIGSVPHSAGDSTQLHRVLVNLLTNAIHAVDPLRGTIDIRVDVAERPDEPRLADARYIRIRVSDNGVGMDEATLQRIFDPFFTTKPVGQGTGLGLAEAMGIVTDHGGVIRAESARGEGSTFTILLPLSQEVPAQPAPKPEAPQPSAPAPEARRRARVLIVDDEGALLLLAGRVLQAAGHVVNAHSSPRAAAEAFEADPNAFDIVVSDITMPEMSGIELTALIAKRRPDIPIVLLSGGELDSAELRDIPNPVHFLGKPYEVSRLRATIDAALASGAGLQGVTHQ
jgi:PAS domain S-box-containing protein